MFASCKDTLNLKYIQTFHLKYSYLIFNLKSWEK